MSVTCVAIIAGAHTPPPSHTSRASAPWVPPPGPTLRNNPSSPPLAGANEPDSVGGIASRGIAL
jgi:hypothetical protein